MRENVGWPVFSPHELLSNPLKSGWTILTTAGPAGRAGAIVRDILGRTQVDCLVVFGGDTAYEILRALGVSTIIPVGELFPGIPLSRAGELQLVTKAGGFGPVDLLPRIRRNALRGKIETMLFGITMGDSSGIGPEIILKSFKPDEIHHPIVVYGDLAVLDYYNQPGFRFHCAVIRQTAGAAR